MIITSHFITLDGVIASPEQWHPAFASPESMDVMLAQLRRADGMLVGRRTFAEFASWWPDQGDDVPAAKETNAIPKYVVSSTLESLLGEGLRLFGDERGQTRLELDRCTPLPHGVLHLVYRTGSR